MFSQTERRAQTGDFGVLDAACTKMEWNEKPEKASKLDRKHWNAHTTQQSPK